MASSKVEDFIVNRLFLPLCVDLGKQGHKFFLISLDTQVRNHLFAAIDDRHVSVRVKS